MSDQRGLATSRTLRIGPTGSLVPALVLTMLTARAPAQPPQTVPLPPPRTVEQMIHDSAVDLVLPGVPLKADLKLNAGRTTIWQTGNTWRMLLTDEPHAAIGAYGFKAKSIVVIVDRRQQMVGTVHHVAMYVDQVTQLGGYNLVTAEAPRLLVTATLRGKVLLDTSLVRREVLDDQPLVRDALERVDRYHEALTTRRRNLPAAPPLHDAAALARRAARQSQVRGRPITAYAPAEPQVDAADPPPGQTTDPATATAQPPAPHTTVDTSPPTSDADQAPPLDPAAVASRVSFNAGRIVYQGGDEESRILLMGDMQVMYVDPLTDRTLTLRADRGVVFVDPAVAEGQVGGQVLGNAVRGVYLEGQVIASDGQYTLRGPRMFYDFATNQAVVLNAVFYTWDVTEQVPIYVRAEHLRQHSQNAWSAEGARLTTSEFHEPHFSVGVDQLTISRQTDSAGRPVHRYRAEGTTLNVGSMPVFYWPTLAGQATDAPPIRRARVAVSDDRGPSIETEWDLFKLLGREAPQGVDAGLLFDVYTKRGVGTGLDLSYDVPRAFGQMDGYFIYDTGDDEPGGREDVQPPSEYRGMVDWQHRHYLAEDWEVSVELGYASDPTFIEEYFPAQAYADKPLETSLYAKKQVDDWAFSFLAKYHLNDFLSSMNQLQSPGYVTEKLPELAYYRIGTPLWDGRLTWYSQNSASAMRLRLPEVHPGELGFKLADSLMVFGIAPGTEIDATLAAAGYDEDTRYRFDTRQELQAPLKIGAMDVTPFVVGRFTAYDDDFAEFNAGRDRDNLRLWAMAGVRLHTAFHRTYGDVDNRLLDIHRLRHIVEPSVTLSHAWTDLQQEDLPVYDYDVESLTSGSTIRLGLRNTLQTQRGGPGRWRSVDFLRIDTDFIINSDDTQRESVIPRYIDHRPELSMAGDHFWSEVAWQVTETLSLVNNVNYAFESSRVEQWNLGIALQHTPRLNSFIESRQIRSVDSHVLRYGLEYLLTRKYHIAITHAFDLDQSQSRNVSLLITRRLPRWLLMVSLDFDTVAGEQTVGIALAPEGFGGSRARSANNPFMQ